MYLIGEFAHDPIRNAILSRACRQDMELEVDFL